MKPLLCSCYGALTRAKQSRSQAYQTCGCGMHYKTCSRTWVLQALPRWASSLYLLDILCCTVSLEKGFQLRTWLHGLSLAKLSDCGHVYGWVRIDSQCNTLQQASSLKRLGFWLQGIFVRKHGASPCLQLLGPVISEARAAPISRSAAAAPASVETPPAEDTQTTNGDSQPAFGAQPQPESQPDLHIEPAPLQNGDGPHSAPEGVAAQTPPPGDMAGDEVIMTTAEHPAAEADMAFGVAEQPAPIAGPAMPPGWAPEPDLDAPELEDVTEEGALSGRAAVEAAVREDGVYRFGQPAEGTAEGEHTAPAAASQRPVAGPARPPDELLAAAAEVHQAVCFTSPMLLHQATVAWA